MVIFEFNISKHGTPRNLGWCFRIVCMFFSHGFAESYLRFPQTTEIEGKAIAAISCSTPSVGAFLHDISSFQPPFILLVQPKRLEVFWKHKQKRKDVIPIVLSLEMPGRHGADVSWDVFWVPIITRSCRLIGATLGFDMDDLFSFKCMEWAQFQQIVSSCLQVSSFWSTKLLCIAAYIQKQNSRSHRWRVPPLNSDCCEKRAWFVGGVQSVVHISLDVLKTPDKAGRIFFVYQLQAADWKTTWEIYNNLDLRSICKLPMLPWIVGIDL